MVKKTCFNLFIIFFTILILLPQQVQAVAVNLPIYFPDLKDRKETIEYVKSFSEKYEPASDEESGATIKVKVFKEGENEFYIGSNKEKVKFDVVDGSVLFDDEDLEVGATWKIWLDINYMEGLNNGENNQGIMVVSSYDEDKQFDPGGKTVSEAFKEGAKDPIEKLTKFGKNFVHNPSETLVTLGLDIIKTVFGDFPQFLINMVVTSSDGTFSDWKLEYTYNRLKKDGDDGNRNKYTKVGEYTEGEKSDWQKIAKDIKKDESSDANEESNNMNSIDNENSSDGDDSDEEEGGEFSEKTEIPVIKADLYNIAMGHIPAIDTNFLTGNKTHSKDSVWSILRNAAAAIIHIAIYIAAVILVISLIFTGIQIVRFSFTDPITEAEYKEKLASFATSIATLIGSVLIMAICIFGSNEFFAIIQRNNNTYELPIRVNVESAGYSFSTTMAGYAEYMAGIEDVDNTSDKAYYTFSYILLVWLNVIAVIFMVFRMLILLVLSIIGPISAVLSIFNIGGPIKFRNWVIMYAVLSGVQIIMALGCMIELKMSF